MAFRPGAFGAGTLFSGQFGDRMFLVLRFELVGQNS